jgi:hypothetical protein
MNGPVPLPFSNICAMLGAFAQAMNLCLVGFGPVHLAQPNVRGVPPGKPLAGKTFAAILDASKYLGASAPSSSSGHLASSPAMVRLDGKPPASAVGYVSRVFPYVGEFVSFPLAPLRRYEIK